MTFIALGNGSLILMLVAFLILAGVIYGFYTREGSGIASHPHDGSDSTPGAEGPGEASGRDEGEGSNLDEHGGN